jgi:hypothetical protein
MQMESFIMIHRKVAILDTYPTIDLATYLSGMTCFEISSSTYRRLRNAHVPCPLHQFLYRGREATIYHASLAPRPSPPHPCSLNIKPSSRAPTSVSTPLVLADVYHNSVTRC